MPQVSTGYLHHVQEIWHLPETKYRQSGIGREMKNVNTGGICGYSHTCVMELLQEMSDIIERHGNGISGPSDGMLFRFAKGTETPQEIINIVRNAISSCNAAMKVIAEDIGIRHVSTYSARHSYATILMKSGVNISLISQSLGHSSIHMTEVYLGCYDKEERICNARKLLDI